MSQKSTWLKNISSPILQPPNDQFSIYSRLVKKNYKISVMEPIVQNEDEPDSVYPVVYLLDANTLFVLVVEIVRLLSSTRELPPFFIVGIGYEEDDSKKISDRRLQEFTPTIDHDYGKIWGLNSCGGDAGLFLRFIAEELKPMIEAQYSVDKEDAVLVGDSLGGLFALYSFFTKPYVFQRYLIGSPAIFWDGGVLWKYFQEYFTGRKETNAQIFIGVGGSEDSEPYHFPKNYREKMSHISLVNDAKNMAKKLSLSSQYKLSIQSHVFEGETHMSMIAPWLCRGLREIFKSSHN